MQGNSFNTMTYEDNNNFLQYIEVIQLDSTDDEDSDAESVFKYNFKTPTKCKRKNSMSGTERKSMGLENSTSTKRKERSSAAKRVTPVVPWRPKKKPKTENRAEKKEIRTQEQKKEKFRGNREENEAAAKMILEKSYLFQKEWNNCKFLFKEQSKQKYYFSQLQNEAEKVRK